MISYDKLIWLVSVTVGNCNSDYEGDCWCSQCPFNSEDSLIRCTALIVMACNRPDLFEIRDGFVLLPKRNESSLIKPPCATASPFVGTNPDAHKTYTTKELSQIIHMDVMCIRRKARAGEINAVKVGNKYLFSESEVTRILEEGL